MTLSGDDEPGVASHHLRALGPAELPLVAGVPQLDLRPGPCVGGLGKFICIGLNYADHAAEAGMPVPSEPVIFDKWTPAICRPNDPIRSPRDLVRTDRKVDPGVVIGEPVV
jgi:2,4-diketo-3-deoxy-L-fuconate hydrolase